MKTAAIDIHQCFQPVIGTQPWRVKPGVGSFLTFEFGSRIKPSGHVQGQWHLWIYLSNWKLFHGDRLLVDSNADRKPITLATRRLEGEVLSAVDFDPRARETVFTFKDFRLVVSPADYLQGTDDRDKYWIFYMPNDEVLAAGPSGIQLERGRLDTSSVDQNKQEVGMPRPEITRIVRLED
jgi:hypothetical protein